MDPPIKKTIDIRREAKQCPVCGQRFSRDARFCPFDGAKLEAATFDPQGDALLGSMVDGRYQIVEVLGEGGTGRVYKVRHAALDRMFAMKLLRRDLARDEELTARFIQEAKATASVQHPHVVEITDFGKLPDGVPFLVTELLVGKTLGEVIKAGGPVPAQRGARILRQIAGALAAAHAVGIVHRDLKPDNVFLVEGGSRGQGEDEVRIVDFGAAKVVGASRVTRDGIIFGTPHYMSPEQASGQPLDHRADIYSLGVIMYEMFTGRVPFEADTYMGVLTQHMFVKPVPPSQASPAARDLGPLETITLTCLAKKPEDRYPSMDALAAEIERAGAALDGRPPSRSPVPVVQEPPPPAWPQADAAAEGADPPALLPWDEEAPARRVPWAWLALGALLVGLSAGLLMWFGRSELRGGASLQPPARPAVTAAAAPPSAAPGPSAPAAPSASGWVPAAPPAVAASALPPATTATTEEAKAGQAAPRAAPRDRAPRKPPPRRTTAIDDVGDPFAVTH